MLRLATRIIRELTVHYRKFSMKEKRFMENSRSIHGNFRSSTQWKQRNYYFVELTLNALWQKLVFISDISLSNANAKYPANERKFR